MSSPSRWLSRRWECPRHCCSAACHHGRSVASSCWPGRRDVLLLVPMDHDRRCAPPGRGNGCSLRRHLRGRIWRSRIPCGCPQPAKGFVEALHRMSCRDGSVPGRRFSGNPGSFTACTGAQRRAACDGPAIPSLPARLRHLVSIARDRGQLAPSQNSRQEWAPNTACRLARSVGRRWVFAPRRGREPKHDLDGAGEFQS